VHPFSRGLIRRVSCTCASSQGHVALTQAASGSEVSFFSKRPMISSTGRLMAFCVTGNTSIKSS